MVSDEQRFIDLIVPHCSKNSPSHGPALTRHLDAVARRACKNIVAAALTSVG
jgi:hypothetical protein